MKYCIDQSFKRDLQTLNHLPRFCGIVLIPRNSFSTNVNINYRIQQKFKISSLMLTKINKRWLISFYHLIFFFISAREATILHTLKYILYIFLFYNWMDIWLVILYMVINQGFIIIVIFKFTFSYHFIETANLKSQLFHNKFFRRQVSVMLDIFNWFNKDKLGTVFCTTSKNSSTFLNVL